MLEQHHGYAFSVAILQISVALSAIASLTKNRPVWIMSLVVAITGALIAANSFVIRPIGMAHSSTASIVIDQWEQAKY